MTRPELAEVLVASRSKRERRRLLSHHSELADVALALEIRDICYKVWASEPAAARRALPAIEELLSLNPHPAISATRDWIAGIAALTRGELEEAAADLSAASAGFRRCGEEHLAAQPLVAKLMPLAMLGRYREASSCGRRALTIFEKFDDELAAGKIELNLSNIAARRERHRDAERYGLAAVDRFARIAEDGWLTMAENSLANTYLELHDIPRAEYFFGRALKRARSARMTVTEAEIEASLGNLDMVRGRYAEALRYFESSQRKYASLGMPHQTAIAELEIAGIYLELGLTKESLEIYRGAAATLRRLGLRAEEARARAGSGRAALKLGRLASARKYLVRAADILQAESNRIGSASVKLELARAEIRAGDLSAAGAALTESRRALVRSENPRHRLAAELIGARISSAKGQRGARAAFERVRALAVELGQPAFAALALTAMGNMDISRGDQRSARVLLTEAAEIWERLRGRLPGEEFKVAFMSERLEPYERLVEIALLENDVPEAFVWTERMKARSLTDSISLDRGATDDPLQAELEHARETLNLVYRQMEDVSGGNTGRLNRTALNLEKRVSALTRKIESLRREEKSGAFGKAEIAELQQRLGAGRALVEFAERSARLEAFVITDKGVAHFSDLASDSEVSKTVEALQFQFGSLKFGAANVLSFSEALRKKADHYLRQLHAKLIQPILSAVGERDLVIVPAGAAHAVPFHALRDSNGYLIEDREVVHVASAAAWLRLPVCSASSIGSALIIGHEDESIPEVGREIASVSGRFPAAKVLTGEEATYRAYLTAAAGRDLIHFACHGHFRADDPRFSGLHLADGWVTVRDILQQNLTARLVTLSACETGISRIDAGDEAIGFARGFLSAGAASVMLSLWTINDAATADIMERFYGQLAAGLSPRRALANTQRESIARGDHPYYWAPFILIGR